MYAFVHLFVYQFTGSSSIQEPFATSAPATRILVEGQTEEEEHVSNVKDSIECTNQYTDIELKIFSGAIDCSLHLINISIWKL